MTLENNNKKSEAEYVKEYTWTDYKLGDYLEGILIDILHNMGEHKNNLYKLQTVEGIYAVWGSYKLDEQMQKQKVQIGMNIRITYNGLIRTGSGFDMKEFTIIIID